MTTVLLVRHGRTTANGAGVLAGWTEGVGAGRRRPDQVTALAARLAAVPLAAVVTSPLQRCLETTDLHARRATTRSTGTSTSGWARCATATGPGGELKKLAKDPLWKVVQSHPSAMTFPGEGGESMRGMQDRAVDAVRDWNARLGEDAVYAVVSHGDVIKAVLADALGMHLDQFQRLVVDPASVSVVTYTPLRPFVVRAQRRRRRPGLPGAAQEAHRRRRKAASSDAAVGGGAGSAP